jgi:hypothetical protein
MWWDKEGEDRLADLNRKLVEQERKLAADCQAAYDAASKRLPVGTIATLGDYKVVILRHQSDFPATSVTSFVGFVGAAGFQELKVPVEALGCA